VEILQCLLLAQAQYYETDVGYVVLEADASAADGRVLADIRALEGTIRARLLCEYKI
jgi:D-3-phosphoglycerate dehydrogenase / 2-oxoglutarate reductase